MNASHGLVGVGSGAFTAALTALLTGGHGLDAQHAASASFIIVNGGGGALYSLYALANWWVKWKWPSAPPLPVVTQPSPQP